MQSFVQEVNRRTDHNGATLCLKVKETFSCHGIIDLLLILQFEFCCGAFSVKFPQFYGSIQIFGFNSPAPVTR